MHFGKATFCKKEKLLTPEEFLFVLWKDYQELLAAFPDEDPAIFIRWTHLVCGTAGSPWLKEVLHRLR